MPGIQPHATGRPTASPEYPAAGRIIRGGGDDDGVVAVVVVFVLRLLLMIFSYLVSFSMLLFFVPFPPSSSLPSSPLSLCLFHFAFLSSPLTLMPSLLLILSQVWDNKSFSNTPVASARFPVGDLQLAKKVRTHTHAHTHTRTYKLHKAAIVLHSLS